MSRKTKIWLWVATALIVAGLLLFGITQGMTDGDYSKLTTVAYETNEYKLAGDFYNITINTDTAEVQLRRAENGQCRVVCYEQQKVKHTVVETSDTLSITVNDTRKWYEHIILNFSKPKITVYLPDGTYGALRVETDTGVVQIGPDSSFESIDIFNHTGTVDNAASATGNVHIRTTTGHIFAHSLSAKTLQLSATTGQVSVWDAQIAGNVSIDISTGDVLVRNLQCQNLISEGSTSNLGLENVLATGKFDLERDTGDVTLTDCDAAEIHIETDTGDVSGNLLTPKIFDAHTDTGKVNVPQSTTGGICEISTDTGHIRITVS